jgi:PAS domain S-box-containing protein
MRILPGSIQRLLILLVLGSSSFDVCSASRVVQPIDERQIGFSALPADLNFSLNQTTAITQDSLGFMWLGTPQGLNRYDGYEVSTFYVNRSGQSISHNSIWSLLSTVDDRLWIGTDVGLDVLDLKSMVFTRVDIGSMHQVFDIMEDTGGDIWIATSDGIYTIDPESYSSTKIETIPDDAGAVRSIVEGVLGQIWIGTDRSGLYLKQKDGSFLQVEETINGTEILNDNYIRELAFDRFGWLWIATFNGGVSRLSPDLEEVKHYDEKILGSSRVRALMSDSEGAMWVGTDKGLHRWVGDDTGLAAYLSDSSNTRSITNDTVSDMFEDESGRVWIGTFEGVNTFNENEPYFPLYTLEGLLSEDPIYSFSESPDGLVYIGTHSGIVEWDPGVGTMRDYAYDVELKFDKQVMSLMVDQAERLWVGTFKSGLYLFEADRLIKHFINQKGDATSIGADAISDIFLDSANRVWISTYGAGVSRYDEGSDSFVRYPDSTNLLGVFSELKCLEIAEDESGNLWVGTVGGGVIVLEPWSGNTRYYDTNTDPSIVSDSIASVFVTGSEVWLGSLDEGISRYDVQAREFSDFRLRRQEIRGEAYGLLGDGSGKIWIANGRSILALDPIDETVRKFDQQHGIQVSDLNQGADIKLSTGQMLFGGNDGVNVVSGKRYVQPANNSNVRLTKLLVNNREVEVNGIFPNLNLDYFESSFSGTFTLLDYANPEKNQYKYKLEGFDDVWVASGTNRTITYTNLDPGSYTLRVQGSNSDGIWSKNTLSIPITINPPLWATWWAYTLYAAISLFLFYQVMLYGLRKSEREAETRFNNRMRLYVTSLDETAECVFNANTNGSVLFSNSAAGKVLGKSPGDLVGYSLFEILFQKVKDADNAKVVLESVGTYQEEIAYEMRNGEQKILEISISAAAQNSDEEVAFVSIARDVTAKSHERQNLRLDFTQLQSQYDSLSKNHELTQSEMEQLRVEQTREIAKRDEIIASVHDRVNDNLQTLNSLLSIQTSKAISRDVVNVLEGSQERIKAVALIHENLYQSQESNRVDMQRYIEILASGLHRKYSPDGVNLDFSKNIEQVYLEIEKAVPCGLIVNELLTNALTHAYRDQKMGSAHLELKFYESAGECVFFLSDDGAGLPKDFAAEAGSAMGLEIVSVLIEQLEGSLHRQGGVGTTFEVRFLSG